MEIVIEGFRFTSNFDSGNLAKVELIPKDSKGGRPLSSRLLLDVLNPIPVPEYRFNIWTLPDCAGTPYENLNRSWFHFGIRSTNAECPVQFIMKNLNKHTRLYSHGMAPVFCVLPGNLSYERIPLQPSYWVEDGQFYMSFIHVIPGDPELTTYFAFTYPYTYEKLQRYLQSVDDKFSDYSDISSNSPKDQIYYYRELVCNSLEGRRVDLLTVTSCHGIMEEREPFLPCLFPTGHLRPHRFQNKRVVFLSARVHPGETPSSYVINGFLDFILRDDDKRAAKLRKMYIFKLIPMLNPDGVARGHYRTDTRGINLNRVYKDPIFECHPSIFAVKALILYYHIAYRVQCRTGSTRSLGLHRNHSWSANTRKTLDSYRGSKYNTTIGVKKSKSSISHTALLEKHNDHSISRKLNGRTSQRSLSCQNTKPAAVTIDEANSSQCKFWNASRISNVPGVYIQPSENFNTETNLNSKPLQNMIDKPSNENIKSKSLPSSSTMRNSDMNLQDRNSSAPVCKEVKVASATIPFVTSHLPIVTADNSHKETNFPSNVGDTKINPSLNDTDKFLTFSSDWNIFVENIIQIRTELIETLRELRETMTTSLTKTLSNTSEWSTTTDENSLSPKSPSMTLTHSTSFFPQSSETESCENMKAESNLPMSLSSETEDNYNPPSGWNMQEPITNENTSIDNIHVPQKDNEALPKVMFGTHLLIPEFSTSIPPHNSGMALYIDMHGHASKRGCFIYGNHFTDLEDKIECMLFPKVLSINCNCFDFSACNFSHKNMYSTDKRDGTSKEGSGRVAIHKMTRIIRSYTLECNYNTGQYGRVSPKPGPAVSVGNNPIPLHVMYKPEVYQQVGRSVALTMLDMEGIPNTGTKLAISDYKVLQGVRDWLRHHIKANDSPTNNANFQCRVKNPVSQKRTMSRSSLSRKILCCQHLSMKTTTAVKSSQNCVSRTDFNLDPDSTKIKWIIKLRPTPRPLALHSCSSLASTKLQNRATRTHLRKRSWRKEHCRKAFSEASFNTTTQSKFPFEESSCRPLSDLEKHPTAAWWPIPVTEPPSFPGRFDSCKMEERASLKSQTHKHPRSKKVSL